MGIAPHRRPIVLGLGIAIVAALAVLAVAFVVRPARDSGTIARDAPAPPISGALARVNRSRAAC